jgi:hypothetical protein
MVALLFSSVIDHLLRDGSHGNRVHSQDKELRISQGDRAKFLSVTCSILYIDFRTNFLCFRFNVSGDESKLVKLYETRKLNIRSECRCEE